MQDKVKNIVVVITFLVMIFGLFFINILKKPTEISKSERRKLATFPSITFEKVVSTDFMKDFSKYATDQFAWRDTFRSLKAQVLFHVFCQKDNHDVYIVNGQASKMLTNLKESELVQTVKKINKLYNSYLSDKNVYYGIIPDKNYFLAEKNGYPHMDYEKFIQIVEENMQSSIKPINLFDTLDIDDYYATDIHWRQEKIEKVRDQLAKEMGSEKEKAFTPMQWQELEPFYGVYYGQSALPLKAEKLYYGTNSVLEKVKVQILNEQTFEMEDVELYNREAFSGVDPYDVYLSGAKAIITLENSEARTQKELLLFRDSFSSSLAPLLAEEYQKITLIDLRYISSPLLPQVVEMKAGQDVLILYGMEVLNNGSILKII